MTASNQETFGAGGLRSPSSLCKSIDPISNTKTLTVDAERFRAWMEELTATRLEGGLINAVVTVDGYLQVTFGE